MNIHAYICPQKDVNMHVYLIKFSSDFKYSEDFHIQYDIKTLSVYKNLMSDLGYTVISSPYYFFLISSSIFFFYYLSHNNSSIHFSLRILHRVKRNKGVVQYGDIYSVEMTKKKIVNKK